MAAAGAPGNVTDVVAWLESQEGQTWSREQHDPGLRIFGHVQDQPSARAGIDDWRPELPLTPQADPCGSGPLRAAEAELEAEAG
jgi:hypothetical protein